ncbi:hypothetical protein PTTG_01163 [Puccinia triticina 1-1 BBBD Race 1]|uniref:Uncharacterized protein n=1 Tax=Puccinia triticina (isolate 1-1 / race 1 (BBBD)) TaxID=630390 RepID=A0A180GJ88_PUCT1|nr:hypothetical protein PTTG_01163 [Puccinia triticina 1-1 BBBD Race 1]
MATPQHQPDISSPTTFKIPNKDPRLKHPVNTSTCGFTIAAAMSLALLNSVSANMLGSLLQPTSLFAVPGSIFDQQNGQVSCGNQGHAAINANVLTQVQCGGSGGTPNELWQPRQRCRQPQRAHQHQLRQLLRPLSRVCRKVLISGGMSRLFQMA